VTIGREKGNAKGIVASWNPIAPKHVVFVIPKQTKREPKIRKPSKRQGAMNYNVNASFNAADHDTSKAKCEHQTRKKNTRQDDFLADLYEGGTYIVH
jgi:hypothetical protein